MRILFLAAVLSALAACSEPPGTAATPGASPAVATAPSGDKPAGPVPDFTLRDLGGSGRRLADWRGQVVMLNFWAPWCPPCREEIPAFVELQSEYAQRGFTVVGIAVDTEANSRDYAQTVGINYPILVAGEKGLGIAQGYGNAMGTLPYTVVLDRQGRAVSSHLGVLSYRQAERLILPLL